MPFVLLGVGVLFLVVAVRGTQGDFYKLLKSEFAGSNSFIPWIAAILVLGLAGYIKPIRPVTHAFIVLIILVLILANGGKVFGQFNDAIKSPVAPSTSPPAPAGQGLQPASAPVTAKASGPAPLASAPGSGASYVPALLEEMFGGGPGAGFGEGSATAGQSYIDVFGATQ